MNVLTDWIDGNPPRAGLWMARWSGASYGAMLYWTGRVWLTHAGNPSNLPGFQYRGLAFDPSRAVECQDAETGEPGMWVPVR